MNIDLNKKKSRVPAAVTVAILAVTLISVTVYAWFTDKRRLETITKINAPVSLSIGAGAKENAANIDMGGIDTDDGNEKKFVFCVFSDDTVGDYRLQLAHTTNIGFTYKIYKATDSGTADNFDVLYTDMSGSAHYYNGGAELSGRYLADSDELHEKSYGNYTTVQENAQPRYWQSVVTKPEGLTEGGFVDYYILEVSWDSTVKNDKETDMVYITAGMA